MPYCMIVVTGRSTIKGQSKDVKIVNLAVGVLPTFGDANTEDELFDDGMKLARTCFKYYCLVRIKIRCLTCFIISGEIKRLLTKIVPVLAEGVGLVVAGFLSGKRGLIPGVVPSSSVVITV